MNYASRVPVPPLSNYVQILWYYDSLDLTHTKEHVFPDGGFELIINLQDRPRKLFDRSDSTRYQLFHRGWMSGAHSEYLVIDVLRGSSLIGAHFRPGGAAPFLAMPADELRSKVVDLEALWGSAAWDLRDRLRETRGPAAKLLLLESLLLQKLQRHKPNPLRRRRIEWAIGELQSCSNSHSIRRVCDELGVSQKHLAHEFRHEVGLSPKRFFRIRRFQNVLSQIGAQKQVDWSAVAYDCAYYDQAHFINDFRAFSGLTPSDYLQHRLDYPNFARAD